VLVICPGLTQTNFSKNMLEQKARLPLDHLRGMTSEQVAVAALRAIERGKKELCLTFQGKLMVFVSRFFPRLADRIAARRVRALFRDEIEDRRLKQAGIAAGRLAPSPGQTLVPRSRQ
jgi:short-subunit dehydrogenase